MKYAQASQLSISCAAPTTPAAFAAGVVPDADATASCFSAIAALELSARTTFPKSLGCE